MNRLDLAALEANYQPYQPPQQQTTTTPTSNKPTSAGKPWWTSLISEGAGAGGAAAGAAIGSAFGGIGAIPGALIGAGLGGLFGGTGGRVIENKVRDNRIGIGDALKEGALTGALSAAGEGFQAIKAAKAAKAATSLGADAAEAVVAAPKSGVIENIGKSLKSSGLGVSQGTKVGGEKIGASASDDLLQTLKDLKIGASAPEVAQRKLETKLTSLRNLLNTQYTKGASQLTTEEANTLGSRILGEVATQPGLTDAAKNQALQEVQNLVNNHAKDTSKLWNFTKQLEQTRINFARNPASAEPGQEVVNKIISGNVRDLLNSKVPGVADTNNLFHRALNLDEALKNASTNKGGGLYGKLMNLSPVKGSEARLGGAIEGTGKMIAGDATGKISGPISSVVNQALRQAPGSIVRGLSGTSQPIDQTQGGTDQQSLQDALMQLSGGGDQQQMQQPQDQSPYPRENLMADIQRDPKNADKYISYYQSMQDIFNPQTKPLTGQALKDANNAQSGLQSLDSLTKIYGQDPSVAARASLPNPFGITARLTGTSDYRAAEANIADVIGRLRSGGAINGQELATFKRLLPQAGDDPQAAMFKINQVRSLLYPIATQQSSGSELQNALLAAQAQGGY